MLPAPNLDDRHFQLLVDDAKRLVQKQCPAWSDHNVSDPGVTLIEAFAQMVDQLIYRLNRVPDLHYLKFLELIGVELRPPAAARGAVTFWLSAPQPQSVVVRAETQVATPRTDIVDPVVFSTTRELEIVPCSFAHAATRPAGMTPVEVTSDQLSGDGFACFSEVPQVNDALLIGLSDAVPGCAVVLRFECKVAGLGIDPRFPPLIWEAFTEGGVWVECETASDDTGGLNATGDILLHVPERHQASIITQRLAGWLRCRVKPLLKKQKPYSESPIIVSVKAWTIGGTVPIVQAEGVRSEVIGRSEGTAGQRFPLRFKPVLPSDTAAILTSVEDEDERVWEEVPHFGLSGPEDRHFRIDKFAGEVQFGPAVRGSNGEVVSYGAVPPPGAGLRLESYRTGGGQRGNVAQGAIRVLKTSVPYVARVENRTQAVGGAEAESLADARTHGPLLLRSRGRAVTAEDFEYLAHDIAPEAARVHCVPEGELSAGVRVLVVPHVASDDIGKILRGDLQPPRDLLERIHTFLDARRLVGTRVLVQPAGYRGLTAVVEASARPMYEPADVQIEVLQALYRLYHPLLGGPDGKGWPFGRSVLAHEVHAALARIPGLDMAREVTVQLFPADPYSGDREGDTQRLDLTPTDLVFSYEHQVRISR